MTHIEELTILSKRLASLLEQPEPGLFSWCQQLVNVIRDIAEFGGYERPSTSA